MRATGGVRRRAGAGVRTTAASWATAPRRTVVAPVRVVGPGGSGTLDGAVHVAAGLEFSCAGWRDDTGWCWGENGEGQLGDGTTDDSERAGPDAGRPVALTLCRAPQPGAL